MDIDSVINGKIDADTDFQASLANLSDDDKNKAISEKKSELTRQEFQTLDKKAKDNEQKFNDQKIRAEKAEEQARSSKPPADNLTVKDGMLLANANIHPDDVDEVIKAAKLLGKSIPDALNDNVVKNILNEKKEIRKSAEVAAGRSARPGQQKATDEAILDGAMKDGRIPEKGSEESEKLFYARRGIKR